MILKYLSFKILLIISKDELSTINENASLEKLII